MPAYIEFPFPTILQNLDTPVDDTDSATKGYVDEAVAASINPENFVLKAGDTMTGPLLLSDDPITDDLQAATKDYVDTAVASGGNPENFVQKAGDTMEGPLILSPIPITENLQAVTKDYVDAEIADAVIEAGAGGVASAVSFQALGNIVAANVQGAIVELDSKTVKLSGTTMTGQITMNVAPTTANHVTTKTYVDTRTNNYLPLSGGTITGSVVAQSGAFIAVTDAPTQSTHVTNKSYVDGFLPLGGGTMTGRLVLNGDPVNLLNPASKQYVDANVSTINTSLNAKLNTNGGTLSGNLAMAGTTYITAASAPLNAGHLTNKQYVDTKLSLAGGNMTGQINMNVDPTTANHVATKSYVDTKVGTGAYLPLTGGNLTGQMNSNSSAIFYTGTQASPIATVQIQNGQIYVREGTNPGFPNDDAALVTKSYSDLVNSALDNLKLSKSGGTMTGNITMAATGSGFITAALAPTANAHLTNKQYVDSAAATKLSLTGGTMSGQITMNVAPTTANHVATKTYVDTQDALRLNKSGDSMTGFLTLVATPVNDLHAATKQYADSVGSSKLSLTGGTLTGNLTIGANLTLTGTSYITTAAAPLISNHVTNKSYVDGITNNKLSLAGGTMTGSLILNAAPTVPLQASTKQYVDDTFAATITRPHIFVYSTIERVGIETTNNAVISDRFNTIAVNLGMNYTSVTGSFFLPANRTFLLRAVISAGIASTGILTYAWKNSANVRIGNGSIGAAFATNANRTESHQPFAEAIYSTGGTSELVYLKACAGGSGTFTLRGSTDTGYSSSYISIIAL